MSSVLWLPFRGFKSPEEVKALKDAFVAKNIVLREYPNWEC